MDTIIGVDIGGSHISCCMYEHTNKVLKKDTYVYSKVNTKESREEILSEWIAALSKTISKGACAFKGIGIAMPGPFDYYGGISLIENVDKLSSLYGVNIRQEIAKGVNIDPSKIRFINDATAFSIAEAKIGCASQFSTCVAITLGTGLGSSFIKDNTPILEGANVPSGGFLYNQSYGNYVADDIFSTRGIINHYKQVSGHTVANVQDLCAQPDSNAKEETFEWFGTELGKFLKPYLLSFNTEVLVIGGNIARAGRYFKEYLFKELSDIEVCFSDSGEDAAIIGAALLLEDDYYLKLENSLKLM